MPLIVFPKTPSASIAPSSAVARYRHFLDRWLIGWHRHLPAVSWLPSPPLVPLGWFRWCCHPAADYHAVPLASALAALDPGIYSGAVAAVARYRHFLDRWRLGWHGRVRQRSEEHTSELQSPYDLVCRLL